MEHRGEGPLIAWALMMLSLWNLRRLPSLLGMPPRLDPFKKQPRKFVLLADMLPRGLAFVLICIAVFCVCLILVGLGG